MLPSCLPPPPLLPDDISLKNRFLTSEGLIGPILVPPERGEAPPPRDSRKDAAIQEPDPKISSGRQAGGRQGPCRHASTSRNKNQGGDEGGGNAMLRHRGTDSKCFTEPVAAVSLSLGSCPSSTTAQVRGSLTHPAQKSKPRVSSWPPPAPRDQRQILRLAKMTRQDLTPASKAFQGPQGWTWTSREHDSAKHPAHWPSSIIFKLLKYFWVFLFPC